MKILKINQNIQYEYKHYYEFLQKLIEQRTCSMFGTIPYLETRYNLTYPQALQIVSNWVDNYIDICILYGWR